MGPKKSTGLARFEKDLVGEASVGSDSMMESQGPGGTLLSPLATHRTRQWHASFFRRPGNGGHGTEKVQKQRHQIPLSKWFWAAKW